MSDPSVSDATDADILAAIVAALKSRLAKVDLATAVPDLIRMVPPRARPALAKLGPNLIDVGLALIRLGAAWPALVLPEPEATSGPDPVLPEPPSPPPGDVPAP